MLAEDRSDVEADVLSDAEADVLGQLSFVTLPYFSNNQGEKRLHFIFPAKKGKPKKFKVQLLAK